MRGFFTYCLILVLSLSLLSCDENKTISSNEFEKNVFYEIFPKILDSIHSTASLLIPPPPPPVGTNYEEWIKSDDYAIFLKNWQAKIDSTKNSNEPYYILVQDSLMQTEKNDALSLKRYFDNTIVDTLNFTNDVEVDLERLITNNKRVQFKYLSDFPQTREFWRNKNKFNIYASLSFSKITFDTTKSFGVINASISRGPLDGFGKRIYVKRTIENSWIIVRIENTWIS